MHGSLSQALLASGVLLLAGCARDDSVTVGVPRLREPPPILDFGEVRLDRPADLVLVLHNDGVGDLHLDAELTGDAELELVSWDPVGEPHDVSEVVLRYLPAVEGPSEATLRLLTDDPAAEDVLLDVTGLGVLPVLEPAPSTLWFGDVEPDTTATLTTLLRSVGSGDVTLTEVVTTDPTYTWELPEGVDLPLTVAPGHAVELAVSCSPADATPTAEILLLSHDLDQGQEIVRLLGEDGEAAPPEVQFLRPAWGSAWLDTETVPVVVHAVDADAPPTDLSVLLVLDGHLHDTATPSEDGTIDLSLVLGAGPHTLRAQAVDPDGQVGTAEVEIVVQAHDEPLSWVLAGETPWSWWSVDDDIRVTVDGLTVLDDANGHQDTHGPVELTASAGSALALIATDVNPTRKALSPLWLHFGSERSQEVFAGVSASSAPGDADYDPSYEGPWPNDFATVEVTVEGPTPP